MHPRDVVPVAAAAALVAALCAAPTTAHAAPDRREAARPVSTGLVSPLSFAVRRNGVAFISQNFAGLLTKQRPGRAPKVVYAARRGTEVGAVSLDHGAVTFATTRGTRSVLWSMRGRSVTRRANLGAHERTVDPDHGTLYGVSDLDEGCAAQWPVARLGPPTYEAIKDTHPYASTTAGDTTYVADAAANAILGVDRNGVVSTVAVMPPIPLTITSRAARKYKMPDCAIGHAYLFEAVPTDVEMGPDDMLYVTSLPGGPEDGALGANGAVFRVDPLTGSATPVVGKIAGAVDLAVAPNGDIYVAELFGSRISMIAAGTEEVEIFRILQQPGAVEFARGFVYATTKVLSGRGGPPDGRLYRMAP